MPEIDNNEKKLFKIILIKNLTFIHHINIIQRKNNKTTIKKELIPYTMYRKHILIETETNIFKIYIMYLKDYFKLAFQMDCRIPMPFLQ